MEPHMQAQLLDQDLLPTRIWPHLLWRSLHEGRTPPANGHEENRDKQLNDSNTQDLIEDLKQIGLHMAYAEHHAWFMDDCAENEVSPKGLKFKK